MVCHAPGDMSKPTESHLSHNDKDSQDQTTVIKAPPPKTATSVLVGESNSNSGKD